MPDPANLVLFARPFVRRDRSPAAREAARRAKAERERRVVDLLNGGQSMAEIAAREGVSEGGMRKYVRALIARRGPEATDEFIAVQVNRLNEALRVSYDAMSGENLATVDRVVRIVRELGRYHGFRGRAVGPSRRRNARESLDSRAGTAPVGTGVAEADRDAPTAAEADPIPDWEFLADLSPQGEEGAEKRRNLLKTLDSRAGMAPVASLLAEDGLGERPAAEADATPDWAELLARLLMPAESGGQGEPTLVAARGARTDGGRGR